MTTPRQRKDEDKEKAKGGKAKKDEDDLNSLENVKLSPGENDNYFQNFYDIYPSSVFQCFFKLQQFARETNTPLNTPEVVVIGEMGHGKSTIIEALFGHQFNNIDEGGATRRPIYLHFINNPSCSKPKFTLKRDLFLSEFNSDKVIHSKDLPEEIEKRNKAGIHEPINILFEYKRSLNMTLIDTPGLISKEMGDQSPSKIEEIILEQVRPPHRHIICVEETKDWKDMKMLDFILKIDPSLERTTFVYSKFYNFLQKKIGAHEINKYLSGIVPRGNSFFVTLLSKHGKSNFLDKDKFRKKIWQAQKRDLNTLDFFQYDKERFESNIGVLSLRKHIMTLVWKKTQESVPAILRNLRAKRAIMEKNVKVNRQQIDELDALKLRTISSRYVADFLHIINNLIEGTSEANPFLFGQTSQEEKLSSGQGEWRDFFFEKILVDMEKLRIPYWNIRLYGGQQFERLLFEFKAIAEKISMTGSDVSKDDVMTSLGSQFGNHIWAACDIAQKKSKEYFETLIEQVHARGAFVMKRLADIAEKGFLIPSDKKSPNKERAPSIVTQTQQSTTTNTEAAYHYIYFTSHVKHLFYQFVDQIAQTSLEKCKEEFYHTNAIYWDFIKGNGFTWENDLKDTKRIVQLAGSLFKDIQARVVKNTILKMYGFFLVPIQQEIWEEIYDKVNQFSDKELLQTFEHDIITQKLTDYENFLKKEIRVCEDKEVEFLSLSNGFCHPSSEKSPQPDENFTPMFGIPLSVVMENQREKYPDLKMPWLVHAGVQVVEKTGLEMVGVFRTSASFEKLAFIKAKLERGEEVDLSKEPADVVVGLLKQFIRDLPSPLFTYDLYPQFLEIATVGGGDASILNKVKDLLNQVPPINREVAHAILGLLWKVKEKSHVNNMTADNLAKVMGVCFLCDKVASISPESITNLNHINNLVKLLIEEYHHLFPEGALSGYSGTLPTAAASSQASGAIASVSASPSAPSTTPITPAPSISVAAAGAIPGSTTSAIQVGVGASPSKVTIEVDGVGQPSSLPTATLGVNQNPPPSTN